MAGPMQGGCLCGAVRFTATPKDHNVGVCHCSMCRRWAAGPFFAMECEGAVKVADETQLGVYRSSEWAERCFCKKCGSVLFYRLVGKDFWAISAEALDDRGSFSLASQIFIDEKPGYYEFANKTHNMTGAEVFAAFAPPGGAAKG
ncbi:MAG: GFA family protein [Xanthobacteraceae bacterium]|nr:GFA family protein [Xanthobacteraceae bacterium]